MSRRRILEDSHNHERWLVSYSDFMTLLFAFFVVMYAISSVNEGKYRVLSDTLMQSFAPDTLTPDPIQVGEPIVSTASNPIPLGSLSDHSDDIEGNTSLEALSERLTEQLEGFLDQDAFTLAGDEQWLQVDLEAGVLFRSGSATLSEEGVAVLRNLVETFRDIQNPITVEGYTDNIPVSGGRYESNWELSAARATAVVRSFIESGIAPQRLAAVGYGEYHPVATNATPQGRKRNRRVTIIIARNSAVQRGLTALSAARSKPIEMHWQNETEVATDNAGLQDQSPGGVKAIRRKQGGVLFTAPEPPVSEDKSEPSPDNLP